MTTQEQKDAYFAFAQHSHIVRGDDSWQLEEDLAALSLPAVCTSGNTLSCVTGLLGICAMGTQTCNLQGQWGICVAPTAQTEVCNNADDDCDGLTNEGLGSTTCGVGTCQVTVQNCVNGIVQQCTSGIPGIEICSIY